MIFVFAGEDWTRSGVWKHKNCEIWKIYELENVSKNVSNVSKKRINVSKIEKTENPERRADNY